MAQGIGLHARELEIGLTDREIDQRRRVWYSLYILDRLLALQLGGSVVIRHSEFTVELPLVTEEVSSTMPPEVSYLRETTKLSAIIEDTTHNLYRPGQPAMGLDMLLETIALLDGKLLEWQAQLPRHLRFDHVHPFESNPVFKRQVVPFLN